MAEAPAAYHDAPLLELRDVTVSFGGVAALNGVSFAAPAGVTVAIIGPNGAGKSTLLNVICGNIAPHSASQILLDGQRIDRRRPDRIARMGVARSFQDPPLVDSETVLQNVLGGLHDRLSTPMLLEVMGLGTLRRRERAATDAAMDSLDLVGLSAQAEQLTGGLSYGARKLIDIARALVRQPRLLLLDEPTSGLDQEEQQSVQRLLRTVCSSSSMSTLIVEHHMDLVEGIADRVVGLEAGRVQWDGSPQDLAAWGQIGVSEPVGTPVADPSDRETLS